MHNVLLINSGPACPYPTLSISNSHAGMSVSYGLFCSLPLKSIVPSPFWDIINVPNHTTENKLYS